MIETIIRDYLSIIIPIVIGAVGAIYGLAKRIELKEAVDLIKTIKEVTHTASEGGEAITVDEKIRIADEVIEILKR